MRKLNPPVIHVYIDYTVVLILLAGPSLFIYTDGITAKCVSLFVAILLALVNFFTVYEGGIIRGVHLKLHLLIDKVVGVFLIISPWLIGFSGQTFLFHVFIGIILLGSGILTSLSTDSEFSHS